MKMPSRTNVIVIGSVVSLALALYFGLTSNGYLQRYDEFRFPNGIIRFTDWGRVALTLVFGSLGMSGLLSLLRKS